MRVKNNLIFIVLAVVTVLAYFFFRFYQIQHRIIFDFDQEEFSKAVFGIIRNGDFTLIGPRVLSDKGFFLGPYFIYALVPFYLISRLHPYGLIYFIITYNIIFFIAASRILSRQWSKLHAIFFLLLWATNALIIRYDTTPWNPISIPLGVLCVWYFLNKIYTRNKLYDWGILGLVLGIFFNQHFQFVYLFLFSGVFLVLLQKQKKVFSIKGVGILVAAFAATYLPLFLFDLRHQFLNLSLFLSFFTEDIGGNIERGRLLWIQTYSSIFQPIIGYKDPILTITFFIGFALALIHQIVTTTGYKTLFYKSTFVVWVMLPFLFVLYNKRVTDYYLISIYPFIYITIVDALLSAKRHIVLAICTIVVLYVNYSLLIQAVRPTSLGMYEKDRTMRVLQTNVKPGSAINVSFNMPPGLATGYTYLLDWYNIKRVDRPGIPLIEINNPKKDGDVSVNTEIGIKIPQEVRK